MSTVLNGTPGNITTQLVATVTALANNGSGGTRVTTGSPHLFGPGDTVSIAAPPLVGQFNGIVIIDSTHFDIATTFIATGTGTVADLSLTPQIQVPTDGDTGSVQLSGLLSTLQGLMDRDQFLNQGLQEILVGFAPSLNNGQHLFPSSWSAPVLVDPPNFTQVVGNSSPEWDPVNLQWLMPAMSGSTNVTVFMSYDGLDEVWREPIGTAFIGAATPTSICCAKDPGDAITFYFGYILSTGYALLKAQTTGGGWGPSAITDTATGYTDIQALPFNGYIVVAVGNSTTTGKVNFFDSNNQTTTVATFNAGATIGTVQQWLLRQQGGSFMILAPYNQAFSALTPGAFCYFTTTDGHTFTLRTPATGPGPTEKIVGLDYGQDAVGTCWIMVTSTGSAANFWRSNDGLTWAKIRTLASLANIESLAAVGRTWVASGTAIGTASHSIVYSVDLQNWYLTEARLLQLATSPSRVRSNIQQFAASGILGIRFTNIAGPAFGPVT